MDYETYINDEFGQMVGKTVIGVRTLSAEELEDLYWDDIHPAMVIIFNDGSCAIPSCDPEGNGPGHLFMGAMG